MSSPKRIKFQLCFFVHVLLSSGLIHASEIPIDERKFQAPKSMFRSLYTFGDSFVDPGNNNYVSTDARSNFAPYGKDFPDNMATGRFSNGLLFADFLAQYLGAPTYQLPYLGPTLDFKEPVTAVSFASASSGFDLSTANKTKAIQMGQQLQYFKEYKDKLRRKVGIRQAYRQIKEAVFYINAGSEEFALNFFQGGNSRRKSTPIPVREYQVSMVKHMQQFIEGLWVEGARRFAVSGLPPLGCIPIGMSNLGQNRKDIEGISNGERKCWEYMNDLSDEFNSMLGEKLVDLMSDLPETNMAFIDVEGPLLDAIRNPKDYGFTEVNKGCCGTGLTEIGRNCNTACELCADASKYVFWDAAHPTEKTYQMIFTSNIQVINTIIRK